MSENKQYPSNDLNLCCFIVMLLSIISIAFISILNLNYPSFESFMFISGITSMMIFMFTLPESNWFRRRK